MKLPPSLSKWAQQLNIFPEEISLALGSLAQKLSPFVPALHSGDEISGGEPNGYDGVARRGIYERLLLSELALADENPDEFVRRAVMGEHLFLNLARTTPSAKRTSVALFDAGPFQIGSPRIAHLALLIVLARRAEAANAAFIWGILQDTELKTFSEVTESNVTSLLNARTAQPVEPEHLKLWREKFQKLDSVDDVWLTGSADSLLKPDKTGNFSVVEIDDLMEPSVSRLQITVKGSSGTRRQTMLELPAEAFCARLLRNPFEVYAPPEKVKLEARLGSFFFDENGGKLFVRNGERKILYYPIPNSPNAPPGRLRQYGMRDQDSILLAAGRLGKSIAMLALNEKGELQLDYPKPGKFQLPAGNYSLKNHFPERTELILPKDNQTLLPIYNLHFPDSQSFAFFNAALTDAANNLFILRSAKDAGAGLAGQVGWLATDVLAAARTAQRFIYVGRGTDDKIMRIMSLGATTERREVPFAQPTQAFFGYGPEIADPVFGLLAVGDAENYFIVTNKEKEQHIKGSPGSEVVGLYYAPQYSAEFGLLELEENRRTLNFNSGGQKPRHIFSSGEEIEKIIVSHRSPFCAYQTVSGKIIVFSLIHRVPVGELEALPQ